MKHNASDPQNHSVDAIVVRWLISVLLTRYPFFAMPHRLMFFRFSWSLIVSLFVVSTISLSSCKGPKAAQADSDRLPDALLWKIEHKDLPAPSYLFGTIHIIPREDFFLPVGLDEAFEKCNSVVFEFDINEMSDIGSLMGMLTGLMMKNGMTLKKLLTREEYDEVSAYFEKTGLPMMLLNRVKPMFLSMLADVDMHPDAMQSDDNVSYELELFNKANTSSKSVSGLETMSYQMSLFDSIPYPDQARMLVEAVRGTNTESDVFDETVSLYTSQNIEGMISMIGESTGAESGDFENVLLRNRNRNWIPVMERKMKKDPVFFAVGAGHLAGEEGVIRLLKKAGYHLSPVSVYRPVSPRRF